MVQVEDIFRQGEVVATGEQLEFPRISNVGKNTRIWQMYMRLVDPKDGSVIPWDASYLETPDMELELEAEYWSEYGVQGKKNTVSARTRVAAGKNAGKKNAINRVCSALVKINALYKHKIDRGYSANPISSIRSTPFLQAAHKYTPDTEIKFPVYAQPKLDGARAGIMRDAIYSRAQIQYTGIDEIRAVARAVFDAYPEMVLDGEMYIHGLSLQQVISQLRNPEKQSGIEFHIFDVFDLSRPDLPFSERLRIKDALFNKFLRKSPAFRNVETVELHSREDIEKYYKNKLDEGYEGIMLRSADGVYEFSHSREKRSKHLLKYKPTFTSEFEIVDFTAGEHGKEKGALIWVLKNADGKVFTSAPKGVNYKERYALYKQFQKNFPHAGKMGTVEYCALSDDGVPLRAKFVVVRDYE